ncbi:MAG: hypothetical protein ACQ5SW_08705 [Sphaerochaetaceae bacterium]
MKYFRPILILFFLVPLRLSASYPLLDSAYVQQMDIKPIETQELSDFLQTWSQADAVSVDTLLPLLTEKVNTQSLEVRQLSISLALQQQRVDAVLAASKPKLGIQATPYSYNDSQIVTGVPNVGPFRNQSHTFGVGGTLSQNLGTGGTITMGLKGNSTYKVGDDSWTHTPSFSASLIQPLWIGGSMIDTSYQSKQLEKQSIQTSSLEYAKQNTETILILQQLNFLLLRQSLLENRYILARRLQLGYEAIQKAINDLQQGLISKQSYEATLLAYYQLSSSYETVDDQISSLNRNLSLVLQDQIPETITPEILDLEALLAKTEDIPTLLSFYLAQDTAYQQALLNVRSATLDTGMFSISDAPQLQLSLQFSPFYTPSNGNNFVSSCTELFSSSQPVVSFSVGFNATDVFRRSSKSLQQQAEMALFGAKTELEQAYKAAKDAVWEIHDQIRQLYLDLSVQMGDYQLRTKQLESERIRYTANISDSTSLAQSELDWYQSAFSVLATLRSLSYQHVKLMLLGLDLL